MLSSGSRNWPLCCCWCWSWCWEDWATGAGGGGGGEAKGFGCNNNCWGCWMTAVRCEHELIVDSSWWWRWWWWWWTEPIDMMVIDTDDGSIPAVSLFSPATTISLRILTFGLNWIGKEKSLSFSWQKWKEKTTTETGQTATTNQSRLELTWKWF